MKTAGLLLRRAGRLEYDKHLFLIQSEEINLNGLAPFYHSVLQAWQVFQVTCVPTDKPGLWLFEEPLFLSSFIQAQRLQSTSLDSSLRESSCVKLGHLMKMRSSEGICREVANIRSSRPRNRIIQEMCSSLPGSLGAFVEDGGLYQQWDDECEYSFLLHFMSG